MHIRQHIFSENNIFGGTVPIGTLSSGSTKAVATTSTAPDAPVGLYGFTLIGSSPYYIINYDNESAGTWVVNETLTFGGGTGTARLVSTTNASPAGEMVIEILTGTVIDNDAIVGASNTADVDFSVTPLTTTIASWLWETVTNPLIITSPTSQTTGLSGTLVEGTTYKFKLTVTDVYGNTNNTTISFYILYSTTTILTITSSIPTDLNAGTVNFVGGTSGEVLGLDFYMTAYGSETLGTPDAMTFSTGTEGTLVLPRTVSYLSTVNTVGNSVTLNSSGLANFNYQGIGGGYLVSVAVKSRSSARVLPDPDRTTIYIASGDAGAEGF